MSKTHIIYPIPEILPGKKARFIQIMHTCHALARSGVNVDLICGKSKSRDIEILRYYGLEPHKNLRINQIPLLRSNGSKSIRISWHGIFNAFCLLKLLSIGTDKSILLVRHIGITHYLLRMRWLIRFPILFESHEIFFITTENKKKVHKLRKIEEYIYKESDGIITITNGLKNRILELFDVNGQIHVIPDGADLSSFNGRRISHSGKKICYTGQLYEWKGVDILISAMRDIMDAELIIIGGDDSGIERLKKVALENGVSERVSFKGHIPHKEVIRFLSEVDVAVIPLTKEDISAFYTSPLKLFEYMSAGVPIVASDLPSIREILRDGENAVLVKPEDPDAVASGIRMILDDKNLAENISNQAMIDVKEYTWDKRAERIISLINSLSPCGRGLG